MGTATLTIDLDALAANWRALDAASGKGVITAATVKADGYGLGIGPVARTLHRAGARKFFVAVAEEGAAIREALGPAPEINIYSGHMPGDTDMIHDLGLVPMLNSVEQLTRHLEALPRHPYGIQINTGMNRLGMQPAEWLAVADIALSGAPTLIMSHLACADTPDDPMNAAQLALFGQLTDGTGVPRSIAATGGILMGPEYHFDMTRPGIGLYGGQPFEAASPVAHLSLPVIQTRDLEPGEAVGYGCTWVAEVPTRIATLSGGYGDGILRAMGNRATLWHEDVPCPLVGRVSMDLLTVDITHLNDDPKHLDLLGVNQTVDDLALVADTIGYEVLTSLGPRFARRYVGAGA
ncbi:alanine racemase [Rhodobacteraceae bacterium MBR-64]|jgi:alanine racemase